jgi:hypothetical protein
MPGYGERLGSSVKPRASSLLIACNRCSSRSRPPESQSSMSTAWISVSTLRSPIGAHTIGKISLPSARACCSSAKHHFDAIQFGVIARMTAWQRDSSS